MAISKEAKNRADAEIQAVLSKIEERQTESLSADGRFWQGKNTHSEDPEDGSITTADRLDEKPTDQALGWPSGGVSDSISLEVHVYDGPAGKGWVLIARVKSAGRSYIKSINNGPESYRNADWSEPLRAA